MSDESKSSIKWGGVSGQGPVVEDPWAPRRRGCHSSLGGLVFGLSLLLLGTLFLLDNLGYLRAHDYLRYWPVLLVALGLAKTVQPDAGGGRVFGMVLAIVGVLLLLKQFGYIHWSLWALWPLVLVAVGLSVIGHAIRGSSGPHRHGRRRSRRHRRFDVRFGVDDPSGPVQPADPLGPSGGGGFTDTGASGSGSGPGTFGGSAFTGSTEAGAADPAAPHLHDDRLRRPRDQANSVDIFVIFGGDQRSILSQDFRGGRVHVIMSGCELDLRRASIASGEVTLDVFALMGGVDLRVPEDWNVVLSASPLLGGVSDRTRKPADTRKTLRVTGYAIMGGVDIRN